MPPIFASLGFYKNAKTKFLFDHNKKSWEHKVAQRKIRRLCQICKISRNNKKHNSNYEQHTYISSAQCNIDMYAFVENI
jgi:hypothetical protein